MLSENVLMRAVGEDVILLNISSHQYYALDSVGAQMLRLLMGGSSIDQVVDQLHEAYDASWDQIYQDVCELIAELERRGLIISSKAL